MWNREFDSRVQPLAKQLEKLHTVLSHDMVQAAAYLNEASNTLAAYAEIGPAPTSPPTTEGALSAAPSPAEQTK